MARVRPHFKLHVSVRYHPKLAAVYADNDLYALWCRLGPLAIERYAARTGEQFTVHDRELLALTGKGRADVARKSLERLADVSPMSAERYGDHWRITWPNFLRKQGFSVKNVAVKLTSEVSENSEDSENTEGEREPAPIPPEKKATNGKTNPPESLSQEDWQSLVAWGLKQQPVFTKAALGNLMEACLDWHRKEGKRCKSWAAAVRSWCRKERQFQKERGDDTPRPRGVVPPMSPEDQQAWNEAEKKRQVQMKKQRAEARKKGGGNLMAAAGRE